VQEPESRQSQRARVPQRWLGKCLTGDKLLADGLVRFSVQTPFQSTFGLQGTGVPVNRLLAPQLNHQDLQIRTMAWATQPSLNGDRFQERISRPLGLIPAMNGVLRQIIDADLEPEEGVNRFLALLQRKGKP
jgi:hypothetical protein